MNLLSILMLIVNASIFLHSTTYGHFQAMTYNFGWGSAVVAWGIIYLITTKLLEENKIILLSKIMVGGSVGCLLYARYFSDVLSYTEILGWMSSVGTWGIILFAGIGYIKIK